MQTEATTDITLTASSGAVAKLLSGDQQFLPPERLLSDLTEAQASAVPPGSPYSIAQVVSHMHFWQQRQIHWTQGNDLAPVTDLDATFAAPPAGAWTVLVSDFLAGIVTLETLADKHGTQPSKFYDNGTVGYGLASSALHNGYHFGQVTLLRRIQGFWPPAGTDKDW